MKAFILILALYSLSTDASYTQWEVTKAGLHARCAGLADMAMLDKETVTRHAHSAKESLETVMVAVEWGHATGLVHGLTPGGSDQTRRNAARKMYNRNCLNL